MQLEIKDLYKCYGKRKALKNVSFSMTPGIYGLLGPNGAGKSTLIGILTGNLKADEGTIYFNGDDVNKIDEDYRRKLGYMPQQQALYPAFRVGEFLNYMAALKGMEKYEAKRQIPEILNLIGLSEYMGSRIKTLSGGMKQRLLIAQAILNNPDILILDEPTTGLDPKQRIEVRNLISRIAVNKIVLIATHVVSDVEFIAKELILMGKGEILRKDYKEKILSQMDGLVYETELTEEQYENLPPTWCIAGVSQMEHKIIVRIITEKPDLIWNCKEVRPSLEDVYLYYFGGL
ncbi:ABC transporter ATP-binding protein [Anaerovoracaceae bacterium 42-11]